LKLGIENRKEVIALAVLGAIALVILARVFWPSAQEPAPAAPQAAVGSPANGNVRRTASGKVLLSSELRLDPTLDLALLARSEQIVYAGTARNIFVAGSLPVPKAIVATDIKPAPYVPPPIPQPPPINLKFFGFASKPGEAKKAFLSQGEDIFIAVEGEIVNRRYRILRISPAAVEVEDVLNNNKQSIPLTQG
jgi:hypothetical protein